MFSSTEKNLSNLRKENTYKYPSGSLWATFERPKSGSLKAVQGGSPGLRFDTGSRTCCLCSLHPCLCSERRTLELSLQDSCTRHAACYWHSGCRRDSQEGPLQSSWLPPAIVEDNAVKGEGLPPTATHKAKTCSCLVSFVNYCDAPPGNFTLRRLRR